jgi:hypothetical protein
MYNNIEQVKESVRHSTDLKYQVGKRPWVMLGLSVVLGGVAARLFMGNRQSLSARSRWQVEDILHKASGAPSKNFKTLAENINLDRYGKNFSVIKNASIGAMTSMAVELARRVVPAILTKIDNYSRSKNFNHATEKVRDAEDRIKDQVRTSVQ